MYAALLALMGGASSRQFCTRLRKMVRNRNIANSADRVEKSGCRGGGGTRGIDRGGVGGDGEESEACLRRESNLTLSSSTGNTLLATPPATPQATPIPMPLIPQYATPPDTPCSTDLAITPPIHDTSGCCNYLNPRG